MKKQTFFIVIFSLFCFVVSSGYGQQSADQLFQAGLYEEDVNGDLKAAITIYEKIILDKDSDRAVAAKAQLHIGLCYEKLGLTEAEKAFQMVINNYPTQIEIVNLAREKLSNLKIAAENLETGNKDFQLQQVWAKPFDTMGAPSPDGRYMSFINWNVPCLGIYEFKTGESKDITSTKGTWEGNMEYAESSIWSPDGKQLAYVWYDHRGVSIRTVGIDSSEPVEILTDENLDYCHPCSWSSDGKHILVVLCHEAHTHEIALIS